MSLSRVRRAQWMTSGLSGSPTLKMCLRLERSHLAKSSGSSRRSILRAVGAEYHTVTFSRARMSNQCSAL